MTDKKANHADVAVVAFGYSFFRFKEPARCNALFPAVHPLRHVLAPVPKLSNEELFLWLSRVPLPGQQVLFRTLRSGGHETDVNG